MDYVGSVHVSGKQQGNLNKIIASVLQKKLRGKKEKHQVLVQVRFLTNFYLFHITFKACIIVRKYKLKNNDKFNETEERSVCTTLFKNCSFASKSWSFKKTLCSVFKQYSPATNRLGEKHPLIIEQVIKDILKISPFKTACNFKNNPKTLKIIWVFQVSSCWA